MIYQFEEFELDIGRYELRRAGEAQKVEPQVFALLSLLVSNHDRVVLRDEVIEQVWGGRFISEAAVNSRVRSVRRIIDDDGKSQRLLKTIHNRGFRFVGELTQSITEPAPKIETRKARDAVATEEHALTSRIAEVVCQTTGDLGHGDQFVRAGNIGDATAHLPLKPSVAVLPFDNMSDDPDQEYFSDGIAEDIITELTKFHSLFVIARNSSFAFKGQAVDVKQLSQKLGVRYLVEGSVRRSGSRVRVTVQLIDAVEDKHIWAERYDREFEDIFAVQDDVTSAIVTSLEPQLTKSERKRALRKPPERLDAWENYQRGLWHMYQFKAEDRDTALGFFKRAIVLDPTFASAHAGLAYALYTYVLLDASPDRETDLARAFDASQTAVRLDGHDSFAWATVARGYVLRREPAVAIVAADNAISNSPNSAFAHFACGHALWHSGRPAEAILLCDEARRLSPYDPLAWGFMAYKASALVMRGEFEEAITWSRRAQRQANADIFSHLAEISALGHLGLPEYARQAIERAQLAKPDISIAYENEAHPITDPKYRDIFHEGLRKAGLPE